MSTFTGTKIILLATMISFSKPESVPNITKCKASDSKCLIESSQSMVSTFTAGIPEYEVETLDPSFISFIDATTFGLEFFVYNTTLKGLSTCVFTKVERDVANSNFHMSLHCSADASGQYKMNGRFMFLSLEGEGNYHIVAESMSFTMDLNLQDYIGKDDKKHWKIKGFKFTCKVDGKSEINLENLFEGNALLSSAAKMLLKQNPNALLDVICEPVTKAILTRNVKYINKFFKHVPVEDLTIEN